MKSISTILTGGAFVTMVPGRSDAEAVLVSDGRISAVGSLEHVRREAPVGSASLDVGGYTVVPGFIDPHHHLFLFASEGEEWRIPPGSVTTIAELLAHVRSVCRAADPGQMGWIRIYGYRPFALAERRSPTASELDTACADRPIHLISSSYHESSVNSMGLADLGWDRATQDPPGGMIVRNWKGRATGVLVESASFIAEARSRNELETSSDEQERWISRAVAHSRALVGAGITRIGDAAVPPVGMRMYTKLKDAGGLPISVHVFPVGEDAVSKPAGRSDVFAGAEGLGFPAAYPAGDIGPVIAMGPAKILADGGERCHMCFSARQLVTTMARTLTRTIRGKTDALTIARRGGIARWERDKLFHTGIRISDDLHLSADIARCAELGLQVAIHAIGNGAVASAARHLAEHRHSLRGLPGQPRIEHALVLDRRLADSLAEAGVMVVTQPSFLSSLGNELETVPLPSPLRLIPLRMLTESGVEVAASSDFPAADYRPLAGVQYAVLRHSSSGSNREYEDAVEVEDALAMYTRWAGRSLGIGSTAGTMTPGAVADFAVLASDPRRVDPGEIGAIDVVDTWVAGRSLRETPTWPARVPRPVKY